MDDRRTFLKKAGLGLAAPIVAELLAVRRALAEELPQVAEGDAETPFAGLREAYSLDAGVSYFNHASIGTVPRAVQTAHQRYLELCERNPWLYMWGGEWEEPREEVRRKAAALLGCHADEVTFSHNTTETFNVLAHGLPLGRGDEVLMGSLNHTGASACFDDVGAVRGYRVRRFEFPVLQIPSMSADDVLDVYDRHINRRTRLLVLPHVDNMVGLRHPLPELVRLARSRGVRYVAVDAAQSVGMLPVDVAASGADVLATSAHKWLQAPKGLGVAYLRRDVQDEIRPMWTTWGQERWKDTARRFEDYGTRNLPAVLSLGDAIDFHERLGESRKEHHHRDLWEHVKSAVEASPHLVWRSPIEWELAAALYAVEVRGQASQDLARRLFEQHGFVVRPFSSSGLHTIRWSPNVANTRAEADRLLEILTLQG